MRRWFEILPSVLRSPDDAGGSDTIVIDPQAEHQLDDDEPVDRSPKPATKTPEQIELEQTKAEVARLKSIADQNAQDARYWADRAKRNGTAPRTDDEPPPRRQPTQDREPPEKPEDLIDDLNKRGLTALKDRGFFTKADLDEALEAERQSTDERITEARSEAEFSGRLNAEFPEMMEDSARVAKGQAPKSELFIKAGEIYRDLVDLDPSLKNSRGLLLIAARQAKAQLATKAKPAKADDDDPPRTRPREDDSQQRRREKIDRQRPDRGREDDDTDGGNHHSQESLEIMKRLKVKPEDYDKHKDKGVARRGR